MSSNKESLDLNSIKPEIKDSPQDYQKENINRKFNFLYCTVCNRRTTGVNCGRYNCPW